MMTARMSTPMMAAPAAIPSIAPEDRPLLGEEEVVVVVVELLPVATPFVALAVFAAPCVTAAVKPNGFVMAEASVLPIAVT